MGIPWFARYADVRCSLTRVQCTYAMYRFGFLTP